MSLAAAAQPFVDERWDAIVPVLHDYIRIPNKSPAFTRSGRRTGTWSGRSHS